MPGHIMTMADIDEARAECQEALDALRAADRPGYGPWASECRARYERAFAKVGRYISEYQIHHSPEFLLKLLAHLVNGHRVDVSINEATRDKQIAAVNEWGRDEECGSCEAIAILLDEARLA